MCGTRPQHIGVGLVAQRCNCKKARLDLEATQAVNQQDASAPQHQPKVTGECVSEQQHYPNIIEDTPDIGGVGQTTQHEVCIEPTAAVAIDTSSDQKGAERMVQPDPDPDPDRTAPNTELKNITLELADVKIGKSYQSPNDAERVADRAWAAARAHSASTGTSLEHMLQAVDHEYSMKLRMKVAGIEASSAADGNSTTKDLPTIVDGSPSPMENGGYKENIPEDVVTTLTHEKLQLAQDCPVPGQVYMAKTHRDTTEPNERYVLSLYDGIGCLAHGVKDKINSLEYTKYIAIEPDRELRTNAQRSDPLTSITNKIPKSTIVQHGICGIHSPRLSEIGQYHIETLPRNSIRLFTSALPKQESLQLSLEKILEIWEWIQYDHPAASS